MIRFFIFGAAFAIGIPLTWFCIRISTRIGFTAKPTKDRWHQAPTPLLGGLGIFLATQIPLVALLPVLSTISIPLIFVIPPTILFTAGLFDDIKPLNAPIKLFLQLFSAVLFIFVGDYQIQFFPWPVANILLTLFWLVGITNAINLLDNMDGLAGGIAFIAACFMVLFTGISGDQILMYIALALAGSLLAFLVFNYPPAKIFMGDSGSLFLGFTLAMLAVARRTTASNVLAVLGVPVLVFLLPILDTSFVTLTRLIRGQSPVQGGRDHTSHRLVSFGIREQHVIWILYLSAVLSGLIGYVLEKFNYALSLWLVPVFLIAMMLVAVYLGKIKVEQGGTTSPEKVYGWIPKFVSSQRVFVILLDLILFGISYYLALWVSHGFDMTKASAEYFFSTWQFAILCGYIFTATLEIYRINWNYLGFLDAARIFFASLAASLGTFLLCSIFTPETGMPIGVFGLFSLFLFLSLLGSRASFLFLEALLRRVSVGSLPATGDQVERVFIYGVNPESELLIRWLEKNPGLLFQVAGIIDENTIEWQKEIRGIRVVGGCSDLSQLIHQYNIAGILLSSKDVMNSPAGEKIDLACKETGAWVSSLSYHLERIRN